MVNSAEPADTGGGSDYYAADPSKVKAAGTTLMREAGSVSTARTFGPIHGLAEGAAVEQAAERLRERWGRALDAWQSALASLGEATEAASRDMADTDHGNAARWDAQKGVF